jgi:hypothetical protein
LQNGDVSCLTLGAYIDRNDITCLRVLNNTAMSDWFSPALLVCESAVTVADSVFQGNEFDVFVGSTGYEFRYLTLENCAFDVEEATVTGPCACATVNPVYDT